MIRSELLQALGRENPDLRAEEVEQVVDTFFDEIAKRLAEGGRVEQARYKVRCEARHPRGRARARWVQFRSSFVSTQHSPCQTQGCPRPNGSREHKR